MISSVDVREPQVNRMGTKPIAPQDHPSIEMPENRTECNTTHIIMAELTKCQLNRLHRRDQKRKDLIDVAHRLHALSIPQPEQFDTVNLPVALQLSRIDFTLLDSTRAAAALPSMPWDRIPPALDLGGQHSAQSLGWKIVGRGDAKRAEKVEDASSLVVGNNVKVSHLANFTASDSNTVHERVLRKRMQVESFAVILQIFSDALATLQSVDQTSQSLTVVDFGAAAGSLILPLAWMFPQFKFIAVDLSQFSLHLLAEKAQQAGLTNVETCCCMIEQYTGPIDIALALHACGCATDYSLLQAQTRGRAFIVSPCCIGKLKFSATGTGNSLGPKREWQYLQQGGVGVIGSVEEMKASVAKECHDSASPDYEAMLHHPRSQWMGNVINSDLFARMAGIADTAGVDVDSKDIQTAESSSKPDEQSAQDVVSIKTSAEPVTVGAFCIDSHHVPAGMARMCKQRIEQDRAQAAREAGFDVYTMLLRRPEAQVNNKQDLLVGIKHDDPVAAALKDALC
jgi:hypothetical protein